MVVKVTWSMSPAADGGMLASGSDELRANESWNDLVVRLAAAQGLATNRFYRPAFRELQADLIDPDDQNRRVQLAVGF